MSNARKFTAVATDPIVATEAPEWIRKMNEHYARTGTVRTADAARLSAAGSARAQLSAPAKTSIPKNDDGDCD
jgi:hypothetical protein